MGTRFEIDYASLAADPRHADLAGRLAALGPIDSAAAFNRYCRTAAAFTPGDAAAPSAEFDALLGRIERAEAGTIRTPWGGVVITLHEPPRVEKFLVVRAGGYLALEKHELKDEHLEVREGAGLLLHRRAVGGPLAAVAVRPGDRFHFRPGVEHCLIGTGPLLVFEQSVDPKGMDQDLIFLYEPDGQADD